VQQAMPPLLLLLLQLTVLLLRLSGDQDERSTTAKPSQPASTVRSTAALHCRVACSQTP